MNPVEFLTLAAWLVGFTAADVSNKEWSNTINLGLDQSTRSQRMFVYWLKAVKDIDADVNLQSMNQDFIGFERDLQDLVMGNDTRNIISPPTAFLNNTLQAVVQLWSPFKSSLLQAVGTVKDKSTGSYNTTLTTMLDVANAALLDATDTFVARFASAARLSLEYVDSPQKLIAGRQSTMVYRAFKRVLLISVNSVGKAEAYARRLKDNRDSFATSHSGIIWGAAWAGFPTGIPQLNKICTLKEMSSVKFHWLRFQNAAIQPVLMQRTPEDTRATALQVVSQASRLSLPLVEAMDRARKLYSFDDGQCNTSANFTGSDWMNLNELTGEQEYHIEEIALLVVQIANGIDVFYNSVKLAMELSQLTVSLRDLVEGNQGAGIPSPPSQEIADILITAEAVWQSMRDEINSITTTALVTKDTLHTTASGADEFLALIAKAMSIYKKLVSASISASTALMIYKTREQSGLLPKLAKEAALIFYGDEPTYYWKELNHTRDEFLRTHQLLLVGAPATNSTGAVKRTEDVCALRLMKKVADSFAALEEASLKTANGDSSRAKELVKLTDTAVSAMDGASLFYVNGSATCEPYNASFTEWKAAVVEVGHLRELTQKVLNSFLFLSISPNGGRRLAGRSKELDDSIVEMEKCLADLKFGFGPRQVPSPPSDATLKQIFQLEEVWNTTKAAIEAEDLGQMANSSFNMLARTDNLMKMYVTIATESGTTVPLKRVNVASQQLTLARQIVNTMLLKSLGLFSPDSGVTLFETAHTQLLNGGDGIPTVIPERADLLQQWNLVDTAWKAFRTQVYSLEGGMPVSGSTLASLKASLDSLIVLLEGAVALYGILDPIVPPPPEPFPAELLVFVLLGVLVFFFLVALCVVWRTRGQCWSKLFASSSQTTSDSPLPKSMDQIVAHEEHVEMSI